MKLIAVRSRAITILTRLITFKVREKILEDRVLYRVDKAEVNLQYRLVYNLMVTEIQVYKISLKQKLRNRINTHTRLQEKMFTKSFTISFKTMKRSA